MMTQVDDKETEFPFDSLQVPAIIVVMGLPFTRTKQIAGLIGRWARCPVLNKDHFLDSISGDAGYGDDSLPSRDEAERLHRLAFDTLCSVATGFLDFYFSGFKCVVIKSPRICFTYELQQLLALTELESYSGERRPLILVECQFGNEFRWKHSSLYEGSRGKWYEAHDWKGTEKAKEDYNAQALDHHLLQLIRNLDVPNPPRVRRLVVDPYYDLNIRYWDYSREGHITPSVASAIKFLLTAGEEELNKEIPQTVELHQLRRYLMEKKIAAASASRERRKYFCVGGACVFKYWESLEEYHFYSTCCCGVCEEPLGVGEPAYTCYFCVLALHKSCAEMPHFTPPSSSFNDLWWTCMDHINGSPEKHACKSCTEAGQVFSDKCASCLFQTHLKSLSIPTVILNPDFHDHMISLQFPPDLLTSCRGCGWMMFVLDSMYGCSICETYYHSFCPFWPKELKHKHGGHEHVMEPTFSHHGTEEEDYWCDICYKDIDPQIWFSSCQHCPYYVAHLCCTLGYVY